MPLPNGDSTESTVYDSPSAFNPYDPPESVEAVQPTSPSPAQSSSDAPGFGDTSGADSENSGPSGTAPEPDPLPEFDPRHREAFQGLLYLGRLQDTFSLWGHKFVIQTLTTEQLAEIGLLTKPYEGTAVENAVYQAAVVAASVLTVDDKPLPGVITVDTTNEVTLVKFPYVMKQWMPPVREAVFTKCLGLEFKVREVLAAMGEASG